MLQSFTKLCSIRFSEAADGVITTATEIIGILDNFNKFDEIGNDTEAYYMYSYGDTETVFKNVVFYLSAARVSDYFDQMNWVTFV